MKTDAQHIDSDLPLCSTLCGNPEFSFSKPVTLNK